MKLSCSVIQDMIPMYYDKVCSKESAALIEEHIKECPNCNRALAELCSAIEAPQRIIDDAKPLKKIQKGYLKMKTRWLVTIISILLLVPIAFFIGTKRGADNQSAVGFTKEEAIAYASEFMTCLVDGDYAKAYTYWDIDGEKKDLILGGRFVAEDLETFEADGLVKFCTGGETIESMGGFDSFALVRISEASYSHLSGSEYYFINYTVRFAGKDESFGVSITENGINSISSGNGLIRHPLSHLTLWVQWVVDDYLGQYYDFDLGQWVDKEG